MDIALDEIIHFDAITSHPSTGAATDADSTPAFSVFEEATDTPILSAQSFTKRTSLTGNYRGTATLSAANGFEVGKWYSIVASATVNAIAGKGVVRNFRIVPAEAQAGYPKTDSHYVQGAAPEGAVDVATAVRTELTTELGRLDVAVSTRASQTTLDTLDNFVDTEVASIKAVTDKLDTAVELDGAVYRYTANALEMGPSGGGGVADWTSDERTAIRSILGIPGSGTTPADPTVGILDTIRDKVDVVDDFLDTEVAAIKAKTDNLPADPADASDIAASLVVITGYIDTEVAATLAAVDTEVAAIKAKTDALPAAPAATGDIPTAAANAAALLDLANGIETSITPRQALRLMLAASAGKLSGAATTTIVIRNVGDSKDRITATVDASGNRSAVTVDAT